MPQLLTRFGLHQNQSYIRSIQSGNQPQRVEVSWFCRQKDFLAYSSPIHETSDIIISLTIGNNWIEQWKTNDPPLPGTRSELRFKTSHACEIILWRRNLSTSIYSLVSCASHFYSLCPLRRKFNIHWLSSYGAPFSVYFAYYKIPCLLFQLGKVHARLRR